MCSANSFCQEISGSHGVSSADSALTVDRRKQPADYYLKNYFVFCLHIYN